MFGKKGRKRREDRKTKRQDRRDEKKDNRLERKTTRQETRQQRGQSRRDARLERQAGRQASRETNIQARQDTRTAAYEAGIDPNAHWGDTFTGAGNTLSGAGDLVGAFNPAPMLPQPSDVLDDTTPPGTKDGVPPPKTFKDYLPYVAIIPVAYILYTMTKKRR
jgi:hypothetical protein